MTASLVKGMSMSKPGKSAPATQSITTSTRRETALRVLGVLRWPVFGALLAGGALVVARAFGPKVAQDLGDAGGAGFAEGLARVQAQLASLRNAFPSVSGERGLYGAKRDRDDAMAEYLSRFPGFVGAGVTLLVDQEAPGSTVYEVLWLRGYSVPVLPETVQNYPVKLRIVDTRPVAYANTRGRYS
jgi:hypothetical protein